MWTFTLLVLSAATGPLKLASPGLSGVQLPPRAATFFSDHLAQQLGLRGAEVMTATEIASMLSLERQKQLLGCSSEASSCMVELADALGVEGLITGSVGKLGERYQLDVKIIASGSAKQLAIFTGTAASEREVLDVLTTAAGVLHQQLQVSTGRASVAPAGGARRWWWVPASVGAASLALGTTMLLLVVGHDAALRGTPGQPSQLSLAQAEQEFRAGATKQAVGLTALGVGGAALIAGAALYLFGSPVAVAPRADLHGGGVSLAGWLP